MPRDKTPGTTRIEVKEATITAAAVVAEECAEAAEEEEEAEVVVTVEVIAKADTKTGKVATETDKVVMETDKEEIDKEATTIAVAVVATKIPEEVAAATKIEDLNPAIKEVVPEEVSPTNHPSP
jgi:hypothetical protein